MNPPLVTTRTTTSSAPAGGRGSPVPLGLDELPPHAVSATAASAATAARHLMLRQTNLIPLRFPSRRGPGASAASGSRR